MRFSKTELMLLSFVGRGERKLVNLAKALNISLSQVYRICKKLEHDGILTLKNSILRPELKTHINLLLINLAFADNLSGPLSGAGISVYSSLLEKKTIAEIQKDTGLHRTTIFKKINEGRRMSLLFKENGTYRINEKLWLKVIDLISEIKKYEECTDQRVPVNSIIYYKTDSEILFSNNEVLDASLTAFSKYGENGIKILDITNYYYLPRKKLSIKNAFVHSLLVAEKSLEPRHLIFIALFLLKHKFLSRVEHPIVKQLLNIFKGKKVEKYPTIEEIRDRAKIYNLEV